MHPSLELPPGIDTEELRACCATASSRLLLRLPFLRDTGAFAHLVDESFEFVAVGIPPTIDAYLAALHGSWSPWEALESAMATFGAGRARAGVSAHTFNRLIPQLRRAIVDAFIDDVVLSCGTDTAFAVYRSFTAFCDSLVTAIATGFSDERHAMAAENDGSTAVILQATNAGVALGDLDGHVVYVNDAFELFLSDRQRNSIGDRWEHVLAGTGLEDVLDTVGEREVWRDIVRADEFGTERVLRVSVRRVRDRIMSVVIDVTHQVEFEQMRREFVRGVMHDVRSPLTLIGGWASTLTDAGDRLDDETRARALQTIHKASNQVARLTETLLEMDLLDAGEHSFRHVPFSVVDRLRASLEATDPDNVTIVADTAPPEAVSDPDAFDRIVGNLVDNALTHGEGPVEVRVVAEDGACVVRVIDAGVCDADRVRAALAGNRVDSSTGFGIGLRACRLLADALGASLTLDLAEPTTLALTLPSA